MDEIATISEPPPLSKRSTVRLTTAQALIRYLAGLRTRLEAPHREEIVPLFGGVFAIFGHGNVAGVGEALYQYRDGLPTYRAHNEQAMAHAAIATTSEGGWWWEVAVPEESPSESVRQAHGAYLRGKENQRRR